MPPNRPDDHIARALASFMSRRHFLGSAGVVLGAAALAACGANGGGGGEAVDLGGKPAGEVSFANWPLYIDQSKDASGTAYQPSLRSFTKATGIDVQYHESISDYPSFFGKLQPLLSRGQSTGFDLIVIGGREEAILMANGWLVELGRGDRPNFDKHAAPWATDRPWDPGNRFTMPWQGGFTGIAVNRDQINGTVSTLDDLANPDKVGRNSVGMITQEMADLVMVNLGIDAAFSGPAEWKEAVAWLTRQRESGTVRGYYDIAWMDELRNGNVSATMAWPGDIALYSIWQGYPQLEFLFPEAGAVRWSDDLAVPAHAEHPVDALMLADSFYQPSVATSVTEWVLYTSPVDGVQERIRQDSEQAAQDGYKGYATKLAATADNPYLFPAREILAQTRAMRILTSDAELEEWNAIFSPISQS
jgi:spermidine/putrescine transport system substrate-binding protein